MPRRCKRHCTIVLLVLFLRGAPSGAPVPEDTGDIAALQYGSGSSTFLSLYQKYFSPLKGGNICPMYPSCSQYAKYEFDHADPATAFASTCDRLIRCGRDVAAYPMVAAAEGPRRFDPPDQASPRESGPAYDAALAALPPTVDSGCGSLAITLFTERNYPLARLEWERTLHTSTATACRNLALRGILDCSYRLDNLDGFISSFYRVTDSLAGDSTARTRCGALLAKRQCGAGNYKEALGVLGYYARTTDPAVTAERQVIASVCHLMRHDLPRASAAADSIPLNSGFHALTDSIRTGGIYFCRGDLSPAGAGWLSAVLPGAGYLYAGKPATGLASFIINGLLIWSTAEFASKKFYGAAAASAFLGAGFYFGNIRGSVKAAQKVTEQSHKARVASYLRGIGYDW